MRLFSFIVAALLICLSQTLTAQVQKPVFKPKIQPMAQPNAVPLKRGVPLRLSDKVKQEIANRPLTPRLPAEKTVNKGPGSSVRVSLHAAAQKPPTGAANTSSTLLSRDTSNPNVRCETKRMNFTDVNQDFTEFATAVGDESWLYPGSILDIGSVLSGSYRSYNSNRNPIRLATSLIGGQVSATVANPVSSNVAQVRSNLITRSNQRQIAARMRAKITKYSSAMDLNVSIYGKYKTTGVDTELSAAFGMNKNKEHYMIDFTQVAYNAYIDDLQGAAAFRSIPAGANPAAMAYINNVVYGRRAIMIVKTSDRTVNFETKLRAAIDGGVSSGVFKGEADYKKFVGSTDISVIIYGGDQRTALRSISFNAELALNGFNDYIQRQFTSNSLSTAVPIGYSLKLLANNDRCTVQTVFTAPVEKCVPITGEYAIALRVTGVKAIEGEDRDNKEDYRLTVTADYSIDRRGKPFMEKNYRGYKAARQFAHTGGLTGNALIKFPENDQLHVQVGQTANVFAEGVLPMMPAGSDHNYDLTLTTYMCERSGDGCSGMVPSGGKRTPINLDAVISWLTGAAELENYPEMELHEDPKYRNMGDGYTPMKPVYGNGTKSPATKMTTSIWTTNRNGRQAFINVEIELIPTPSAR